VCGRFDVTMNPDPEAFEELRRLLALKRYEQPPPGYFDRFPREVIARIKEQEAAAGLPMFPSPMPRFQRLWNALEARAVFPTAFGAAVCALLIVGLTRSPVAHASAVPISERLEATPNATDSRPVAMPVVERSALEPSRAGVLPGRPSAGMFRDLHGPLNPGDAPSLPLHLPPAK
jgi:hypothetical protein